MKSEFNKPILLFSPMDMLSHHLRCLQLADAIKNFTTCIFAIEKNIIELKVFIKFY